MISVIGFGGNFGLRFKLGFWANGDAAREMGLWVVWALGVVFRKMTSNG